MRDYFANLSAAELHVIMGRGTERDYSGCYCSFASVYAIRCRSCGTHLYSAQAKIDARTGFPSFHRSFEKVVVANVDFVAKKRHIAF